MGRRMLVDARCHDLAEHFLSDLSGATAEDIADLAEAIQRACEDACETVERAWLSATQHPKEG